jgi:hypothetical protein
VVGQLVAVAVDISAGPVDSLPVDPMRPVIVCGYAGTRCGSRPHTVPEGVRSIPIVDLRPAPDGPFHPPSDDACASVAVPTVHSMMMMTMSEKIGTKKTHT